MIKEYMIDDDNTCDRCQDNDYTHAIHSGCYCDCCFEWMKEYNLIDSEEEE